MKVNKRKEDWLRSSTNILVLTTGSHETGHATAAKMHINIIEQA